MGYLFIKGTESERYVENLNMNLPSYTCKWTDVGLQRFSMPFNEGYSSRVSLDIAYFSGYAALWAL